MSTESAVNPYEPPSAEIEGDDQIFGGHQVASRWRRFFGYLVDAIALFAVFMGIDAALISVYGIQGTPEVRYPVGNLVVRLSANLLYYIVMEGVFNRTLGKFVLGTVVVNEDGERPSLGSIVGRSFARWIPFDPLLVFRSSRMTWHDSLSRTMVVMKR